MGTPSSFTLYFDGDFSMETNYNEFCITALTASIKCFTYSALNVLLASKHHRKQAPVRKHAPIFFALDDLSITNSHWECLSGNTARLSEVER